MTQVDLSWTNILAFWGAFLSSVILVWDIYKWKTAGERLRLTVTPNTLIIGDQRYDPKQRHISVRIENYGERPTTITTFGMTFYSNIAEKILRKPKQSMYVRPVTFGYELPYKLDPGTYWTGLSLQTDDIEKMVSEGLLYVEIYHSNKKRSLKKKIVIKKNDKE